MEIGPGEFAGELALLDHTPRNASLTATTTLTIYICSPTEFRDIMNLFPAIAHRIEAAATQRRTLPVAA
jgi:CRP-like cAMP-binding protein